MKRHKADTNQTEIVKTLRSIPGVSVMIINSTIDICVGYKGVNYLIEIKKDSKQKMKPSQEGFFMRWTGQVMRADSIHQILNKLNLVKIHGQWKHFENVPIISQLGGEM